MATEGNLNILLLGPAGAGKSSFIDSCKKSQKLSKTGRAEGCYKQKIKFKHDNDILGGKHIDVRLINTTDIKPTCDSPDISTLVEGFIQHGYKFEPKKTNGYKEKHKIHCIVFVVDVSTVQNENGELTPCNDKMKIAQAIIKKKGPPLMLILTKVDFDNFRNDQTVLENQTFQKAKETVIKEFSIDDDSVFRFIIYDQRKSEATKEQFQERLLEFLQSACEKSSKRNDEEGKTEKPKEEKTMHTTGAGQEKQAKRKLQIMYVRRTQDNSSREFALALEKLMSSDFDCELFDKMDERDNKVKLIVVCPHISRYVEDVEWAIRSVGDRSSRYVMIILHVDRELPEIQTEKKICAYNNINFIDMGWNEQDGIFKCKYNTEDVGQLCSYLGIKQLKSSISDETAFMPWARLAGFFVRKFPSDTPWRYLSQSSDELQKEIEKVKPDKKPAILFIGHTGAGKSSFINSCKYVSTHREETEAEQTNAEQRSILKLKTYTDENLLNNFKLIYADSVCFEQNIGEGLDPWDIINLLQGHIMDDYKFDPQRPITTESKYYRHNPQCKDKTYCVVFVVDATKMNRDITKTYVQKLQLLRDEVTHTKIPRVLILTKVDLLCNQVHIDESNIFRSLKIQKAMKTASEAFSIDMASIHPVINYTKDTNHIAKPIPILIALRQMLHYACDREEYVQNNPESDSEYANN